MPKRLKAQDQQHQTLLWKATSNLGKELLLRRLVMVAAFAKRFETVEILLQVELFYQKD